MFLAKLEIIKNGRQFVLREKITKFVLTCRWASALKYVLEPQYDFDRSLIGLVIEFAQITLKIARKRVKYWKSKVLRSKMLEYKSAGK